MAVEGDRLDFMFLAPRPLTRPLDPLLGHVSLFILLTARDCVYVVIYFMCPVCCTSR